MLHLSHSRTWNLALIVATSVLLAVPALAAKKAKVSKDLAGVADEETVDVIIQFTKNGKSLDTKAAKARAKGLEKARHEIINGGAYTLKGKDVADLSDDDDIAYISPDRPVQPFNNISVPAAVNMPFASLAYNGSGVTVAVIDSGLRSDAADTKGRIIFEKNYVPTEKDAKDLYGHGTHISGIIGGNGANSKGSYRGLAPMVKMVNLRVLDRYGNGSDSQLISAIQDAIALKAKYNIRVVNISLGRPVFESYTTDPLCQAVQAAWKAGIVVVVAAGNYGRQNDSGNQGYGTITSPGNSPYVITVGGMKANGTSARGDDTMSSYSSKGPTLIDRIAKPDLVAPGNHVVSMDLQGGAKSTLVAYAPLNRVNDNYMLLNGTSMATGSVSGAVALMIQKDPTLTPDQVKARLMKTAAKSFPSSSIVTDPQSLVTYTTYYDMFTVGAGYLDVAAALANTDKIAGEALSPRVVPPSTNGVAAMEYGSTDTSGSSIVWGSTVVWGSSIVWGSTIVWGTTVVSGNTIVWGSTVPWNDSTTQAYSILWGQASLSATQAIFGSSVNASDTPSALSILINGEDVR